MLVGHDVDIVRQGLHVQHIIKINAHHPAVHFHKQVGAGGGFGAGRGGRLLVGLHALHSLRETGKIEGLDQVVRHAQLEGIDGKILAGRGDDDFGRIF